jgi:glycosyltransferase involved in cell wall biosynthesis
VARAAGALGTRVVFHGLEGESGVAAHMRRADALVLFSAYENSPCVVAEALASGLPVIAPDVGGLAEHLTSERGVLVSVGDPAELRAALSVLARCERVFDRHAMREYAVRTFSRPVVAAQLSDLYRGAAGRRPPRSAADTRRA